MDNERMRSTAKVDPTFGTAIRHARTERRMSQESLAFAAGLHVGTLGCIERAKHTADWRTAEAIADALEIPLQKLVPSRPPGERRERPPTRPDVNPYISVTVRRLREGQGITQQGLAEEANITLETLGRLERGGTSPRMNTMEAVADGLGLTLPELIDEIVHTREETNE